jgi:hypothetical protein
MYQLPPTPPYTQKEWNTIQHLAKANVFPHALLVNLNAQILQKLTLPSTEDSPLTTTTTPKRWVIFTFYTKYS